MRERELYYLSDKEAKRLPKKLRAGKKDRDISVGDRNIYLPIVQRDGMVSYINIEDFYSLCGDRPAIMSKQIKSLKRNRKGEILYGRKKNGKPYKWLDVSSYLGKPVLLLKKSLFSDSNRESADIKDFIKEFDFSL